MFAGFDPVQSPNLNIGQFGMSDSTLPAQAKELRWTAVRAAVLTNKPGTSRVQASNTGPNRTIPRADLASFLVEQLSSDEYVNQAISVTAG